MFLVDDILLFPMRSLGWIFRELYNAAEQELAGEADGITASLSELYMMLETNQITEEEFDARERELLDRLEKIQKRKSIADEEAASEDAEDTEG